MSPDLRELDYQQTQLGELILRARKSIAVPDTIVYEVKLNDAFLMSSVVNDSERALARLALEAAGSQVCDVLVGGLGLGYTAAEALTYETVRRLDVVEYLQPVIDWHDRGIVPTAQCLTGDPRCHLMQGDFPAAIIRARIAATRSFLLTSIIRLNRCCTRDMRPCTRRRDWSD